MRKTKFRAWNGKEMYFPQALSGGDSDGNELFVSELWYGYEIQGICDDILMQFTGVWDKEGKEVYEGDIVMARLYGNITNEISKHQVRFKRGSFELYDANKSDIIRNFGYIEIIGNTYENGK